MLFETKKPRVTVNTCPNDKKPVDADMVREAMPLQAIHFSDSGISQSTQLETLAVYRRTRATFARQWKNSLDHLKDNRRKLEDLYLQ